MDATQVLQEKLKKYIEVKADALPLVRRTSVLATQQRISNIPSPANDDQQHKNLVLFAATVNEFHKTRKDHNKAITGLSYLTSLIKYFRTSQLSKIYQSYLQQALTRKQVSLHIHAIVLGLQVRFIKTFKRVIDNVPSFKSKRLALEKCALIYVHIHILSHQDAFRQRETARQNQQSDSVKNSLRCYTNTLFFTPCLLQTTLRSLAHLNQCITDRHNQKSKKHHKNGELGKLLAHRRNDTPPSSRCTRSFLDVALQYQPNESIERDYTKQCSVFIAQAQSELLTKGKRTTYADDIESELPFLLYHHLFQPSKLRLN